MKFDLDKGMSELLGKLVLENRRDWDKAVSYIDANSEAAGAPHIKFLKA
jgi:hypothetical protein